MYLFKFNRFYPLANKADSRGCQLQSGFSSQLVFATLSASSRAIALPLQLASERAVQNSSLSSDCQEDSQQDITLAGDRTIEQLVSHLLKFGVLLASAIVLLGGWIYLSRHGTEPAEYQFFHGEPTEFCSPWGVVQAVLSGNSLSIIQLGILLLIATPIVRVVFCLSTFIWQRDLSYIFITSFVLAGLLYSLIGAYI